uniref:Uncharacterized protein n=1 Tax=Oryza punctata TaxID=4537 RepID=A0A0E0JK97_ORYPU
MSQLNANSHGAIVGHDPVIDISHTNGSRNILSAKRDHIALDIDDNDGVDRGCTAGSDDIQSWPQKSSSSMPVAAQDHGRVGVYWYSAAMSAYFDDKKHYEVIKQVMAHCFMKTPPRPRRRPDDITENLDVSPCRLGMSQCGHVVTILIVVLVSTFDADGWGISLQGMKM